MSGEIRLTQGFFSIARTCHPCNGAGRVVVDKCPTCGGAGMRREEVTLEVPIPPGVDTGTPIRSAGNGEPPPVPGGAPGDLYVVVQVKPHPIFAREGTEVICEVPISFAQAALGASIDVPTLDGPARLKIPAGTQHGKVFRMKGEGDPGAAGVRPRRPARADPRGDAHPPHRRAAGVARAVRVVFYNAHTHAINVLYRRRDGMYGLIEPEVG